MIEEIFSLARYYLETFGKTPSYLIIGQDQFFRFIIEFKQKYNCAFIVNSYVKDIIGKVGAISVEICMVDIIVVSSDIIEIV